MLAMTDTMRLAGHEDEVDGSERRRGLRVRQDRPVKVYAATAGRYFGGRTADVSSTGLRIELPAFAPVAPGATIHIHVGLTRGGGPLANRRQMMPARVIWIDRATDPTRGTLHAGIELLAGIAAHLDAA